MLLNDDVASATRERHLDLPLAPVAVAMKFECGGARPISAPSLEERGETCGCGREGGLV